MHPVRMTGLVLLSVALLFGLVLMFVPMAESWLESEGLRTEEEYGLWSKERMLGPSTTSGTTTSTSTSYSDGDLDGTGGITYLRAAGPLALVGFLFAIAGLVLTAVPKTREGRMSAWFILPAFVLSMLAMLLWSLGIDLHAEDRVHTAAGISVLFWIIIPIFYIGLLVAAFVLALIVREENVREVHHYHEANDEGRYNERGHDAHGHEWTEDDDDWTTRTAVHIRCPSCSTVSIGTRGTLETCQCGFSKAVPA